MKRVKNPKHRMKPSFKSAIEKAKWEAKFGVGRTKPKRKR